MKKKDFSGKNKQNPNIGCPVKFEFQMDNNFLWYNYFLNIA